MCTHVTYKDRSLSVSLRSVSFCSSIQSSIQSKMLQFVNHVYEKIQEHKLVRGEKRLLLSVSGGQDSMCLLLVFYLLRVQMRLEFDCIWLNHFWQRSSFFTMLQFSRSSYSLSLRTIFSLPLKRVLSEQSARDWRKSATQRTHLFYRYDLCVQGHSKSDRAETVLFNLIRGAGLTGVSALRWAKDQSYLEKDTMYPLLSQLSKETHAQTAERVDVGMPPFQTQCVKVDPNRPYLRVSSHSKNGSLSGTPQFSPIELDIVFLSPDNTPVGRKIAYFRRESSRANTMQARSDSSRRKTQLSPFEHLAVRALLHAREILPSYPPSRKIKVSVESTVNGAFSTLLQKNLKMSDVSIRERQTIQIHSSACFYYQAKQITV